MLRNPTSKGDIVANTCNRRRGRHPILTIVSFWGIGSACGLILLRRGFFCPAFALVSFSLVVGPRSMLVFVGPRGGGFVCLNIGSHLVLVFPSLLAFVCVRRRSVAACPAVSFLCVVGWCLVLVGVGCGPSRFALVMVVL